jgi:hypothetical protein
MAALGRKVKNALDEARILVLGVQVLLGFQYRGFMEPGYERLPLRVHHGCHLCAPFTSRAFVWSPWRRSS